VIGFGRTADLQLPLTEDPEELRSVLRRAGARVGATLGRHSAQFELRRRPGLPGEKACAEFSESASSTRRRSIVVLFAAEDLKLGSQMESPQALVRSSQAHLYAVVLTSIAEPQPPSDPRMGGYCYPTVTA
jgi:hypothetical protein